MYFLLSLLNILALSAQGKFLFFGNVFYGNLYFLGKIFYGKHIFWEHIFWEFVFFGKSILWKTYFLGNIFCSRVHIFFVTVINHWGGGGGFGSVLIQF